MGRPVEVAVTFPLARGRSTAETVTIAVGDRFRARGRRSFATLTVEAFTDDGLHAWPKRNTSRRGQSVMTRRLATDYDRA